MCVCVFQSDERTVSGFARVKDGAGLVFTVDNIPYAMEYDIMIRYVPEVCHTTTTCVTCVTQPIVVT